MRRPHAEAHHAEPFLDDLVAEAVPHLEILQGLSVRDIQSFSQGQLEALRSSGSSSRSWR